MFKMSPIALVFVSTVALAGGQLLSGAQIRDKIVHNTLVGAEDGAPVFEFFNDDGIILGQGNDGKYTGSWQIKGNKLCVSYDDDEEDGKAPEAMECMAIALSGDQVTRLSAGDDINDDDNDDVWTLKQGNPELLTSDTDDD